MNNTDLPAGSIRLEQPEIWQSPDGGLFEYFNNTIRWVKRPEQGAAIVELNGYGKDDISPDGLLIIRPSDYAKIQYKLLLSVVVNNTKLTDREFDLTTKRVYGMGGYPEDMALNIGLKFI